MKKSQKKALKKQAKLASGQKVSKYAEKKAMKAKGYLGPQSPFRHLPLTPSNGGGQDIPIERL
jgi:hypothetical protein